MISSEPVRRAILLVEDNPIDLDLTRRAFARSQLVNPLEVARDGAEALAWLARWEAGEPLPLVVLLDLKLPKVDGLEVLRQIRASPDLHRIPVVVLTSSREESDLVRSYELGVNAYVVKPLDFDQFMQAVRSVGVFWAVINAPPPGCSHHVG